MLSNERLALIGITNEVFAQTPTIQEKCHEAIKNRDDNEYATPEFYWLSYACACQYQLFDAINLLDAGKTIDEVREIYKKPASEKTILHLRQPMENSKAFLAAGD